MDLVADDARRGADRLLTAAAQRAARLRGGLPLAVIDSVLVALCFAAVLLVRYEGTVSDFTWARYGRFLLVAIPIFVGTQAASGLYGQMWRHASVLEARRLILAGSLSTAVLTSVVAIGPRMVPLSVVLLGSVLTTMLVGAARFQSRLFAFRRQADEPHGLRVIVLGAGETGAALIRQMRSSPRSGLVPVALLDDDPRTHGRSCLGVRVMGPISSLAFIARQSDAHQVLMAVPTASPQLIRDVADLADVAGLALRMVSDAPDAVPGETRLHDVRDVRIDDLLGRQQVVTDLDSVRAMLEGRRVLITGAGGSIGSEIARQVAPWAPSGLLLLDHDETHLHDAAASVGQDSTQLLADIRDGARVMRLFEMHKPEVVFHAAAHKHVPLLESHPGEAARTNVAGTQNIVDAARNVGVEVFVFISTDKAVHPSSVMGASKRVAEHVVLARGQQNGDEQGRYCGVRFGNVLGSRGSVIPTFVRQMEAGGPLTVTDARMTRYFMSIPEAVQLVLQSATMAVGGEIFMLEMGEPVPIMDLAKRMIRLSGRRLGADVAIRVTGSRPGEKLSEELHTAEENPQPTLHPSIVRLQPRPVACGTMSREVEELAALAVDDQEDDVRRRLFALAEDPELYTTTVALPHQLGKMIDLTGSEQWSQSTI